MQAARQVEISIELPHDGKQRSVLLAGTFTDPQWALRQMQPKSHTEAGQLYVAHVTVKPDTEYHYRFKCEGEDDSSWIVNESTPTATGRGGNTVNLICFTETELEFVSVKKPLLNAHDKRTEEDIDLKSPLFAHECLGAYEISDEILGEDIPSQKVPRKSNSSMISDDVDFDDPTLETFPCDKEAILGTLRKIQSSHSDSAVSIDEELDPSRQRRSSTGSSDGETSTRGARRLSQGSTARVKSLAGLGSIAEEPKGSKIKENAE